MYDDKKKSCREMLERIRARRAATKEKKKKKDEEDCAKAAAAALGAASGGGGTTVNLTTNENIIGGNAGFPPPHHHGDNNGNHMAMIMPDSNNNVFNDENNSNYQMMMAMIEYNNRYGTGSTGTGIGGNGSISLLPDTTFSRNYNTVTVADVSDAFRGGPHPIYGGATITASNNDNNHTFIPTTTNNNNSNTCISIMNQQDRPTQTVFNGMLQTFAPNHYQPQQQQQQQQQQVNMNPSSSSAPDGSGLLFTVTDTNNATTNTTQILTQDLLINLSDEIKNDPNFLIDALVMFNDFQKSEVHHHQDHHHHHHQEQQSQLSPSTMQLEEEPSNGQLLAVDGSGTHTNSKSNSDVNGGSH
jgi:hypothetical protein